MLLSVFSGQKYSYSYETETGHYLRYDNKYTFHAYLQGDDARIFEKKLNRLMNYRSRSIKPTSSLENTISIYL